MSETFIPNDLADEMKRSLRGPQKDLQKRGRPSLKAHGCVISADVIVGSLLDDICHKNRSAYLRKVKQTGRWKIGSSRLDVKTGPPYMTYEKGWALLSTYHKDGERTRYFSAKRVITPMDKRGHLVR